MMRLTTLRSADQPRWFSGFCPAGGYLESLFRRHSVESPNLPPEPSIIDTHQPVRENRLDRTFRAEGSFPWQLSID
jgi:hypothetical protein